MRCTDPVRLGCILVISSVSYKIPLEDDWHGPPGIKCYCVWSKSYHMRDCGSPKCGMRVNGWTD